MADSRVEEWTVTPSLEDGLSFDSASGIIRGVYTGAPKVVPYWIEARNTYNSVQFSITIEYKGAFPASPSP